MKLFHSRSRATTISISNDTIIRALLITITAWLGLRALDSLSSVLTLIAVSFFLAIALNPAVKRITTSLGIKSRALATGLAYVFVLAILALFLALVVPPLVNQTTGFIKDIPQTVADFRNQDSSLAQNLHKYKLDTQIEALSKDLSSKFSNLSGPVLTTASRIGGIILSIITVLVLTFMMLVEGPDWLERVWQMQPADERQRRKKVAYKMYRVITSYVNGQVLIAAIAAIFAAIALFIGSSLTNVSINPVALAGIVFIFGLIPLIGNTLAAVIVVLFCLLASPALAIGMTIYFLVYQQTENATLQPYIQSKNSNLTPLIVFVSAILGASLGGLLGALAAIPAAGCLRILFDEYIVEQLPQAEKANETQLSK